MNKFDTEKLKQAKENHEKDRNCSFIVGFNHGCYIFSIEKQ
jgi:hypothetical protein